MHQRVSLKPKVWFTEIIILGQIYLFDIRIIVN